jgi:hypothetical protein
MHLQLNKQTNRCTNPHQVIDAQLLELQHHVAQVAAQDLGVGLLLQVGLEAGLGVQPEALAGPRAPCTAAALVRRRLQANAYM